jgi:hypothetical protein
MAVVIRMKNVSRVLIFLGSLIVWTVLLTIRNDAVLGVKNDYIVLLTAGFVGLAQTWVLAMVLHT